MDHEPVSQGWMITLMDGVKNEAKEGHGRLRQSVNQMNVDMKSGFATIGNKQDALNQRLNKHSERLVIIEKARETEAKQAIESKQHVRDRTTITASLASIVVTVGIFFIKWFQCL